MSALIVDKEAKKAEILAAAMTVFAEKGFGRTRMEDVAKQAGIGKGTVYEYFRSKDELFFALYQSILSTFHEKIFAGRSEQTSSLAALEQFIILSLSAFDEWHEFGIILLDFWTEHRRGTEVHLQFSTVYDMSRNAIAELIGNGIRNGEFAPIDPVAAASAIIAILDGIMLQRIFDPQLYQKLDIKSGLLGMVFDGLKPR
jgi:AcrR family transcriptional regulator